ncbi:MAG: zinc-ribbon domain-containing protein [Anaerovoracaceae bacterium]|jgi:hypothetical protein
MKYCIQCGQVLEDDMLYCPRCGAPQNHGYNYAPQGNGFQPGGYYRNAPTDSGSIGWGILGFFVPVAGLVLWLVWKDKQPKDAKYAGLGALISVCIQVFLMIISMIIGTGIFFEMQQYF